MNTDVVSDVEEAVTGSGELAVVLGVFYLILTVLVSIQIGKIVSFGHNLLSFQSGFLLLCFSWSILRAVLFLLTPRSTTFSFILVWLPTILQFATFLLLAMYYAYLVDRAVWDERRPYWENGIVASVVISIIIATACTTLLQVMEFEVIRRFQVLYAGIMFLILSTLLLYYGYRLYDTGIHRSSVFKNVGESWRSHQASEKMLVICGVIIVCFLSRAFCDLAAASGWMGYGALDAERPMVGFRSHPFQATVMLLFWEIVPSTILIAYFWHIPQVRSTFSGLRNRGAAGGLQQLRADYGAVENIPSYSLRSAYNPASSRQWQEPLKAGSSDQPAETTPLRQYPGQPQGQPWLSGQPPSGGPAPGQLPSRVPGQVSVPVFSVNGAGSGGNRLTSGSTLMPLQASKSSTSINQPKIPEGIRRATRPLLENPARYDTDDEGGTPRR